MTRRRCRRRRSEQRVELNEMLSRRRSPCRPHRNYDGRDAGAGHAADEVRRFPGFLQ